MIKKLISTKFKKDLIFSYFAQGITIGLGFIQLFLINRYFGVETYGQLAIIMSTAGIFSALLTARSSEAITRFFTREMINNNFQNAKFILTIGFCIDIITALFMIGLTYLLSEFVAETFMKDIEFSSEVFLYSFVIFFGFLRGTIFGYFQSKEMFFLINTITIFESFIKIVALILIVFVFSNSTLEDVIWTLIVASFLSFLYALIVFLKHYIQEFWTTHLFFNKVILKEYWSFNIKTFTSSSLKAGATNIDNLVLSYYANAQMVGIYQTIKKMLSPLAFVIAPFSTLTLTKIVSYYESKNFLKLHDIVKKVTVKLLLINIVVLVALFLILEPFLTLQNITTNNKVYIAFFVLAIFYSLPLYIWWGRNFIILYNPMLPIYSNLLLSVNSIWIPIMLYKLDYFDGLITICVGVLLAYIPSWLFAPVVYLKFMRKVKII